MSYHADAAALYAAIPAARNLAEVAAAHRAADALWAQRGSYGCEQHHHIDAVRRVTAILREYRYDGTRRSPWADPRSV